AKVTVISPKATQPISALAQDNQITWHQRKYQSSDMQDRFLVIGATDDEKLNLQIQQDASEQKTLCNIADRPAICNFILPAIVQRGDLVITASTSGQSPAFAKRLRKELQQVYGEEYTLFLKLMGAIRKKLLKEAHEPEVHKPIFEALIDGGLLTAVKNKDINAIDTLLGTVLGNNYSYRTLISASSSH
ncbi:MAG: bifunctional precorrin-2 dehydrogenase/sirohydrochlorin ferrochelatase, partial [Desulfobacteraceae bacterium]